MVLNGVLVVDDSTRVPLDSNAPGWAAVNLRGGYRLFEHTTVSFAADNLLDRGYRTIGSGVDAAGISVFASPVPP